jgi:geranylgeranyl diphosphate synthase type II
LIAASLSLGAVCGGASPATVLEFHDLGLDAGLAFQIHDDLLNAGSSLGKLGKRAGTDEARGKATWPRAVGVERAAHDAASLYTSIGARIEALGPKAARLRELFGAIATRTS